MGTVRIQVPKPVMVPAGMPEQTGGLPVLNQKDARSGKLWEDQAPFAGQIVFATSEIDQLMKPKGGNSLKKEFTAGEEVHLRAVWPTAFRNMPIGYRVPSKGASPAASDDNNNASKGIPPGAVPLYGPPSIPKINREIHQLEIGIFVLVNGKRVENAPLAKRFGAKGVAAWSRNFGQPVDLWSREKVHAAYKPGGHANPKPDETDFWAYNLSIKSTLLHADTLTGDDWRAATGPISNALLRSGAGKHEVTVEMKFRIVVTDEVGYWKKSGLVPQGPTGALVEVMPERTTPWSHPFATGSFTLAVPSGPTGAAAIAPRVLPVRQNTSLASADAERLEFLISDHMRRARDWGGRTPKTEELLGSVAITGNWAEYTKSHNSNRDCAVCHLHGHQNCRKWNEEPYTYGVDFEACFYRSPLKGWAKEEPCVRFRLAAMAYQKDIRAVSDIIGIAVGGHSEFDADWIPESAWPTLGVERCPERLRNGL